MEIKRIVTGMLRENCYIVTKNGSTIVIDPGDDFALIKESVKDKTVKGILITHRHFDHVGALKDLEKYLKIEASSYVDGFDLEVIKTPGHTKDSVSYYFKDDNCIFTGDFLFKGTVGRMDLPGGSVLDMEESLNKVRNYPSDLAIYPGHGEPTTLGAEKPHFEEYLSF